MDLLSPTLGFMHALHIVVLQPLALAFSALGSEPCYLLLLPLVYWLVDRRTGARLGILLLLSVLVNDLVKVAFHLPRPYWVDSSLTPLSKLGLEQSFGFPSGHAQGAFLVWPFLAMQTRDKRRWLPLALALASCIALSRMILGVHWPLDVVGGALLGGGLTAFYLRFGSSLERAFRSRSRQNQLIYIVIFVALCGGLSVALIGQAVRESGPNLSSFTRTALSLEGKSALERCAALGGLLVGLVLAPAGVEASTTGRERAMRLLVGFAGLIAFYFGFKVFSAWTIGAFLRYFLTTFWVSCGALWAFRALKIARSGAPASRVG